MPRSGWLAIGAAGAALAIAGLTLSELLVCAGILLATTAVLIWGRPRTATGTTAVRGRVAPWRRASLAIGIGALAVTVRAIAGVALEEAPARGPAFPDGSGPWTAVVVSVSPPLDGQQRAVLELRTPGDVALAASLPRYPAVAPGDEVRVGGAIRAPGDDGYGQYLARIGVAGTLRSSRLEILGHDDAPVWLLERIRRASGEALSLALAEPEAGLAAGILIGLRDRVDRALAADFTTAGVSHVVAISGWNIAILAAVVSALARGLSRRRRAALTLAATASYVAFAGASASVLRAAVMAAVVLVARESGRAGQAATALGWAATILLLVDPRLALDPGFQLSTMATAGLLAWGSPLAARLAGPAPGRVRRWLSESLGVSLAAQAATLPIVLATFGRLSIVAPAVNLLVVPLVAPAMAVGGLALLAGWLALAGLPAGIAVVAGLPAWALLGVMVGVVRVGASLPFASLGLDPPLSLAAGLVAGAVLIGGPRLARSWRLTWPRDRRAARPTATGRAGSAGARAGAGTAGARAAGSHAGGAAGPAVNRAANVGLPGRLAAIAICGAIASLGLVVSHLPDGVTRIVALDVGQGDAILIEGARGGRLLVDTGPDPDRLLVLLDERLPPWDRRLDAVVITHPHEDHIAGLALLLTRYRVGRVLDPGMHGPGPGYAAAAAALATLPIPHETLAAGDRLAVDDLTLEVLWPQRGEVPTDPPDSGVAINNVSIILRGTVEGRRVLLTGDAEADVDSHLIEQDLHHVDLLKVAHHGSATATTEQFLDAVSPAVALISVGAGNSYGHPAAATLDRLRRHGTAVMRTDLQGTLEVRIHDGSLLAEGERGGLVAHLPEVPVSSAGPAANGPAGLPSPSGEPAALLYHRIDVGPVARGRRGAPPRPRSSALVRSPRAGRRRDRGLAGQSLPAGPDRRRRPSRRDGRAPPRRRQAAPAR